jgi:hypothetical protein
MLPVGRARRRALSARVPDHPYPVDELSDGQLDALDDPLTSPWARRRRPWRWWVAALLPVIGFVGGWLVARPDGAVVAPARAAAPVAAEAQAAGPTPTTAPAVSLEEAQRLGEEAARRWLEDWAAIAKLAGTDIGGTGGPSAPPARRAGTPGGLGIPRTMLQAYQAAEQWATGYAPACKLSWAFVAGVGRVESNHGRHGGAGFTATGQVMPPIVGIPLDGRPGVRRIADTDGGRWDGDSKWDRAVGPMQFLPTSWRALGRDGDGDGAADPHNAYDAAVSAAAFLCRGGGGSLANRATLERAVHAYNHSASYVQTVLSWADAYGNLGLLGGRRGARRAAAQPLEHQDRPDRPGEDAEGREPERPAEHAARQEQQRRVAGEQQPVERAGGGAQFALVEQRHRREHEQERDRLQHRDDPERGDQLAAVVGRHGRVPLLLAGSRRLAPRGRATSYYSS